MAHQKKVIIFGVIMVLLSILIDAVFVHHHIHYWFHGFIGFDAFYGFIMCIVLIKCAKGLGKLIIQREENYYDGGEGDDA